MASWLGVELNVYTLPRTQGICVLCIPAIKGLCNLTAVLMVSQSMQFECKSVLF